MLPELSPSLFPSSWPCSCALSPFVLGSAPRNANVRLLWLKPRSGELRPCLGLGRGTGSRASSFSWDNGALGAVWGCGKVCPEILHRPGVALSPKGKRCFCSFVMNVTLGESPGRNPIVQEIPLSIFWAIPHPSCQTLCGCVPSSGSSGVGQNAWNVHSSWMWPLGTQGWGGTAVLVGLGDRGGLFQPE